MLKRLGPGGGFYQSIAKLGISGHVIRMVNCSLSGKVKSLEKEESF